VTALLDGSHPASHQQDAARSKVLARTAENDCWAKQQPAQAVQLLAVTQSILQLFSKQWP